MGGMRSGGTLDSQICDGLLFEIVGVVEDLGMNYLGKDQAEGVYFGAVIPTCRVRLYARKGPWGTRGVRTATSSCR